MSSLVYFARPQEQNRIKIGFSRDLGTRLRAIQSECKTPILLLGTLPGDASIEARIHYQFSNALISREWFRATEELISFASHPSADLLFVGPLPRRKRPPKIGQRTKPTRIAFNPLARELFRYAVEDRGEVDDAASALGCTRQMIYYIISGQRTPGLDLAIRIEDEFLIPVRKWVTDGAANA